MGGESPAKARVACPSLALSWFLSSLFLECLSCNEDSRGVECSSRRGKASVGEVCAGNGSLLRDEGSKAGLKSYEGRGIRLDERALARCFLSIGSKGLICQVLKWLTDGLREDMLSPSVDDVSRFSCLNTASSSAIGGSSAGFCPRDEAVSGLVECTATMEADGGELLEYRHCHIQ